MGGDYFALCLALEELGKVDQSVAITLEAGVSLGAMPIYRFGNDAQKQEWLPLLTSGTALGALRPHRGRRRHRRRRHQDHRHARRRRLGDQRHQAVHHQLRHRHHQAGHRHRGHRGTDGGRQEISSILVPVPTPGFTAEPAYDKVGWNASDTHPLTFDDVRVPAGEPARRAGPRLRQLPAHPRRGPHRDRRAGRRCRAGLRRRDASSTPRNGARSAQPIGTLPGHRVQDRPDGGPRPRGPHRLLRRRRADAGRQAVQEGGGDRQAGRPARPRWTTRATPPRSSAATAS